MEAALPPGSLIHVGQKRSKEISVKVTSYNKETVETIKTGDLDELKRFARTEDVAWLQVTGLHDIEKISELGHAFDISPLVLEDALNTTIRAKIEERGDEIFIVTKLITLNRDTNEIDVQQISLILLPHDTVITFQEAPTKTFDPVIERIRTGGAGRIRNHGGDYLLWAILDTIVDHYLMVAEHMDDHLVTLDDRLQTESENVEAAELYGAKRDVTHLYRNIRPIREISNVLLRGETRLIEDRTKPYYNDLHDHVIQVTESTEDLRETSSALRDFYLSAVSNRMNEVMKVLTCFSTIFLPLTFLAGIYGMNFEHMPELSWKYSYPTLWIVFVICAIGMIWLFRKKRWL